MTWKDLLEVKITDQYGVLVGLGPIVVIAAIVVAVGVLFWHIYRWQKFCNLTVIEAEISLGSIGKVKIKPSNEDGRVAHKAWVELITRKAAIPFDEQHDVIVEVYDSWYALFKEIRYLTKEIPAETLRSSKDTKELVRILVKALNSGLRPHLTQWQAKFRRWYKTEIEKDENSSKSPQEIQMLYPRYAELVADLKQVNTQVMEYAKVIQRIAHGNE